MPLEWFRWLPLAALALFETSLSAPPPVRSGPLSFFDAGHAATRQHAGLRPRRRRLAAGPPAPAGPVDPWVASICDDIVHAGVPAITAYPAGRHIVDLCVGEGSRFFGVELTVHPDGPDAHIERHLALRRAGWELVEGHHSRWGDRRSELVVELLQAAHSRSTSRWDR